MASEEDFTMFFNHAVTSRDKFSLLSYITDSNSLIRSNLLSALIPEHLLILVPVILCGCSGEIEDTHPVFTPQRTVEATSQTYSVSDGNTLDIFAFENDRLKRLDSYQRIERFSGSQTQVASTGGSKIFFSCLNGPRSVYNWADINSYSSLYRLYCSLEDERHDRRCCTGEAEADVTERKTIVRLVPLSSEIVLQSVRCDFSGTPYAGAPITDVKVYLTNVSASCPVLIPDGFGPTRIINCGMLCSEDLKQFRNPEIIMQEAGHISDQTTYPDICLLCYPNMLPQESFGRPATRLVLEGKIESMTYYWPITINPGTGIDRGNRYVFDLLIRRKGVTDPDIPFELENIEFTMRVKPWREKEEYSVGF